MRRRTRSDYPSASRRGNLSALPVVQQKTDRDRQPNGEELGDLPPVQDDRAGEAERWFAKKHKRPFVYRPPTDSAATNILILVVTFVLLPLAGVAVGAWLNP